VRQDFERIGRDLLSALLARINGEDSAIEQSVPELIERASTGRHPAAG